jgi:VCBS repeat-containing protein
MSFRRFIRQPKDLFMSRKPLAAFAVMVLVATTVVVIPSLPGSEDLPGPAAVEPALAFESIHDPNLNDTGYCGQCHTQWTSQNSALHQLHTGGDSSLGVITSTCTLCHTGSGRDNPLTVWSAESTGTPGFTNGLGCAGCHGRDYGNTILEDYRSFPIAGLPKATSAGLRDHHAGAGITACTSCHDNLAQPDPAPVDVQPENVPPPYFLRSDVLGGAADPCADNLDNDGDGLYDAADPDCAGNTPPVANGDAYSTDEDTTLNVAAPGVLTNDTDADSDPLTAIVDATTSNGSLALNADGSFTYTPNLNYFGPDSFTYHANDGTDDSNIATVDITVNDVNDPPVSDPNGPYTGTAGLPVTFNGSGSSDVDGTIVTYAWDFGDGGTGSGVSPAYTYGAAGTYTVSLTVTDNDGGTDTATTTATIAAGNAAPIAVDDAYSIDEDLTLNVPSPGVLDNDSDPDGDPITAVLDTSVSNGTLTLNAGGGFIYTPDPDFNGANDTVLDSNIATVTITVNAINDAPVASGDSYATDEDVTLNVAAAGVLGNDADVDGDALTAVLDTDVANGTLTLSANGSLSYTPDADFNGSDSFTYHANDGALDSGIVTVTITVNAVNDPPVAVDDGYTTDEDTTLNIAAPGVLGNDTDVESDPLTAVLNHRT